MKKVKKTLAVALTFAMTVVMVPQSALAAKKQVKLNKKSVGGSRKDGKGKVEKQQKESEMDCCFRQEKCSTEQKRKNRCYHQGKKSR